MGQPATRFSDRPWRQAPLLQIPAANLLHTGEQMTTLAVSSAGFQLTLGSMHSVHALSSSSRSLSGLLCAGWQPSLTASSGFRLTPHHCCCSCPLQLTQFDLFAPGTAVTITNWLGSCMVPCDQGAVLPQPDKLYTALCMSRCACLPTLYVCAACRSYGQHTSHYSNATEPSLVACASLACSARRPDSSTP
jgi:hypothetical protein